jgi:HPr kinase/phosphorylase
VTVAAEDAGCWHHATTIALPCPDIWLALMITGASGSGKSELALQMMALGARLVADDQTHLRRVDAGLVASGANTIRGLIEMRGIGILRADPMDDVKLAAIVDLDQTETRRLPPNRSKLILGVAIPVLHAVTSAAFAAALVHYMRGRHWELHDT